MMKRKFGEKMKRKKRGKRVIDTLLECTNFIEFLILLPIRILISTIRFIINLLNF
ncbi:hypothetical protein QFZ72_001950 [Bacillus sp. V2I10]|nr:hypothetical protein [Bacillus sp. V2I10]